MNQLYICWEGGPKTIKEEFDMLSSCFSKSSVSQEEVANMEKLSRRKFVDFIPEDCFSVSNVPVVQGETKERLKQIFDFVLKSPYHLGLDFFDNCKSSKEAKLYIVIQALLIEILYNNHNIGILLSKESTIFVYEMVSEHFHIDLSKVGLLFKKILSKMLYDGKFGFKTIISYEEKDDGVCYIVLSTTQTLCHHTISN